MTKRLITIGEGTTVEAAKELLHKNRIEKLLVVDGGGFLKGLHEILSTEASIVRSAGVPPALRKTDANRSYTSNTLGRRKTSIELRSR